MSQPGPLVVLICAPERTVSRRLYRELANSPLVQRVVEVADVGEAGVRIAEGDVGLVIVDSATPGAMAAGGLLSRARERGATAALLRAAGPAESNGGPDRTGREGLLSLDPDVSDELLPHALHELLRRAQGATSAPGDGGGTSSPGTRATPGAGPPPVVAGPSGDWPAPDPAPSDAADPPATAGAGPAPTGRPTGDAGSVFLSYRFAEESGYVQGLRQLLEHHGFRVVNGRGAEGSVSAAVLRRIRDCDRFLALMTRHRPIADPAGTWTTSSWLIEEKGAALAFGKRIVLLVEEGITDIGGLQGDWQRNVFTPQTFMTAALEAVRQLESTPDGLR